MLLAAGVGARMRPLTEHTPKPLLKVGSKTLIEHALERLKQGGIQEVMINIHHLGDQIVRYLGDGSRYGLRLHFLVEKERLETAGGIFQVLPFFENQPFVVMSADIWTDYPIENLPKTLSHDMHLVMVNNPHFRPEGDFGLNAQQYLTFDTPKLTYASIAVLHPQLFKGFEGGFSPLFPFFKKAIEENKATGEYYSGRWENLTSPEQWEELNKQLGF